jgi:hypothetical protein
MENFKEIYPLIYNMPSAWASALKKWNRNKNDWCIPRKGTPNYRRVREIMEESYPMPKTKRQLMEEKKQREVKQPEIKQREVKPKVKRKKAYVIETDKYYDYDFSRASMSKAPKYYEYKNKHYFVFNTEDDRSLSLDTLHFTKSDAKYKFLDYLPAGILEKPKEEKKREMKQREVKQREVKPEVKQIEDMLKMDTKKYKYTDFQAKLLVSYSNLSRVFRSRPGGVREVMTELFIKAKKRTLNYFKKFSANDKAKVKDLKAQLENTGANVEEIKRVLRNLRYILIEELTANPPELKKEKPKEVKQREVKQRQVPLVETKGEEKKSSKLVRYLLDKYKGTNIENLNKLISQVKSQFTQNENFLKGVSAIYIGKPSSITKKSTKDNPHGAAGYYQSIENRADWENRVKYYKSVISAVRRITKNPVIMEIFNYTMPAEKLYHLLKAEPKILTYYVLAYKLSPGFLAHEDNELRGVEQIKRNQKL